MQALVRNPRNPLEEAVPLVLGLRLLQTQTTRNLPHQNSSTQGARCMVADYLMLDGVHKAVIRVSEHPA